MAWRLREGKSGGLEPTGEHPHPPKTAPYVPHSTVKLSLSRACAVRGGKEQLEQAALAATGEVAQLRQAHVQQLVAARRQVAAELVEAKSAAEAKMREAVGSARAELKSRCCPALDFAATSAHQ